MPDGLRAGTEGTLEFAITSHGFGHATRSFAILREFAQLYPQIRLLIAADLDEEMVARHVGASFELRRVGFEPGAVQSSCFDVDVDATRAAYREFFSTRDARIQTECDVLRSEKVDALVSDIPALPFAAAGTCGVPSVGLGNFTWDWIVESYFEDDPTIPQQLAADYARGDLFLHLPMGSDVHPFPNSEPAPPVGRVSTREPASVREDLNLAADERVLLVCAGGIGAEGWKPIRPSGLDAWHLLCVGDLPIEHAGAVTHLPQSLPTGVDFPDLVAIADVVLTKPGYGIATECWLSQTPCVGVERFGFRESTPLVEACRSVGPFEELGLDAFFNGEWLSPIEAVLANRKPWAPIEPGGARRVAMRLGEFFGFEISEPVLKKEERSK